MAAQVNGVAKKPAAPRAPVRKPGAGKATHSAAKSVHQKASPVQNKAASVAGGENTTSAYAIMASRIANRVAEMAESITLVERQVPQKPGQPAAAPEPTAEEKKKPRKLEMRLNGGAQDSIAFSAPFLDNTLQKMLALQNRMLRSSAELSKVEGADEKIIKEHASQSAELSRIIALICAEKARQGA
ncbi:hypothetical protein LTR91_023870 [Friedmanniomyces endolithicus]|uniref:Uncharacterized protein n=1 Tax=Friedmanniomyces endolithicus TaxID=329885 RepID=A0AAN6K3Q8_9PEZI|nr:hypothetical protein LTS09_002336 [Friedmanniomyces endolithicus]KAK0283794.1 hypothetical protein LTR35_006253 [Friedmanniomyces endolithicus]KAK0301271.1 hypothetical protein LTS00_000420 [Friedmanniomyces endolithicus]KAK0322188.1 hypothetical protein LTR82_006641 [Friedmanniomyces endolithicus]KAK0363853.1 hypothetical protein LTR94_013487 [Friedmanniomyces endolithicus]